MNYDAKENLREVHLSSLEGQSNIYGSCLIPTISGPKAEKVLISTLQKEFRVYSSSQTDISYQENIFSYLPQGSQVIAIDLFICETRAKIISGVAWTQATSESISYFFNVYESSLSFENHTCITSKEISWVPFQITHCKYDLEKNTNCFALSGSDCKIHVFVLEDGAYVESQDPQVMRKFPEFALLDTIAIWTAFQYQDSHRVTAIAQENGVLLVCMVDLKTFEIKRKHSFSEEGPLTKVIFFENSTDLFLLASLAPSRIFYNVFDNSLDKSAVLPLSDEFDVPTTCALADIDFDGHKEILIGTFGEKMLVYKSHADCQWRLEWSKCFNNPIHGIFSLDITNDGVKELLIVTTKTLIFLQHDHDKVKEVCKLRLNFNKQQI